MNFLSPWGLLWLGAIPALVWLWRLAATHRRFTIPSLVPFEHLLKRLPRRRSRLVVNLLFWLQLASLMGLAAALAQPVIQRRAKTVLVVLDTSASMEAGRAFPQALRAVESAIATKAPTDQFFIVASAPFHPLTPEPTSDAVALSQAVQAQQVRNVGGNLAAAVRVATALLPSAPERLLVVTDEPAPAEAAARGPLRWVTVGTSLPNVALVGVDAQGPLCAPDGARVIAMVHNFSAKPASVVVSAVQRLPATPGAAQAGGRRLAEVRAEIPPQGRSPVTLAIPEETTGWVDIALSARDDALKADNHAWVNLRRTALLPITVRVASPQRAAVLSHWLGACEALVWTADPAVQTAGSLVITDQPDQASEATAALLLAPEPARPVVAHWMVSSDHPIGSYLPSVDVVAASLNVAGADTVSGLPVISALVEGRRVPVVVAEEHDGRRAVVMRLDPATSQGTTPVLLAFFNSVRWLMGSSDALTTGTPVRLGGFAPGPVRVHRPDGRAEDVAATGGWVSYDATETAGLYRFVQGRTERTVGLSLVDPIESDLLTRRSTWRPLEERQGAGNALARPVHPLSNALLIIVLVALVVEWWRWTRRFGRA